MSDGQTTWSLLDVNEPALHGTRLADPSQPTHMRSSSLTSSLSSYGGDSSQGRTSGLTHASTEITLDRQAVARPKTNVRVIFSCLRSDLKLIAQSFPVDFLLA